jgi:hypothetical protein
MGNELRKVALMFEIAVAALWLVLIGAVAVIFRALAKQ